MYLLSMDPATSREDDDGGKYRQQGFSKPLSRHKGEQNEID